MKHTPGPWEATGTEIVHAETGNHLATVVRYGVTVGECPYMGSTPFANARLIAAAPDLLAALEALTATARTFRNVPKDEQYWGSIDDEALDAAFEAIRKAKGE